ncbi:MAG: Na+/H+ antiporter subunit A [Actinobacteria bacterium]|nr:Na+/H+ antiporter subunit A [Actinomycetota bacterium]
MLQLLILHAIAALVAPVLVGWIGRRAFLLLAAVPASAAAWAALNTGAALSGEPPSQTVLWVGGLGMHLQFRLDALSWLMTLIVGGIGALVLVYSAAYFAKGASGLGRFAAVFVAFAGAMLGLVTADNTLLLYVFWELTTISSYVLIGHYHERQASRRAASQAIMVTTLGGLAMLAGLVLLAGSTGGSSTISVLVERARTGELGAGDPAFVVPTAIVLVLAGAVTKSALLPFHFWLPAAMAAPTPVSAYLHAAAMVKAGVYLVARLAPGFGEHGSWRTMVLTLGLGTLLLGGYRALRQHDLKLLLAFGTVSQLGMMIAMVGYGTRAAALAGLAMIAAHSMFKASLFLVVGIIDWSVGTRDMRELSGLGRSMPVVAAAGTLATASMIGLPPFTGYVAKEAALEALAHDGDWLVLGILATGSALTVAYGLRFLAGAFGTKAGVARSRCRYQSRLIAVSPVVLALAGLAAGLVPAALEGALAPHADAHPGAAGHLVLWGGFGVPLLVTVAVLLVGYAMFRAGASIERFQAAVLPVPSADRVYRRSLVVLENLAADVTAVTQRGSLPAYLSIILAVMVVTAGGAAVLEGALPESVRGADWWGQVAIAAFIAITALLAARSRRRLKAVLLLGASGYGMALLFAAHGAPDLALTQVMVETITLVIFVLVLRRLPTYFSNRPLGGDRYMRMGLGIASGGAVGVMGMVAVAGRTAAPVSEYFPDATYTYGYGRNIVNVLLVDTRAWDTMGEISVILVAATGVASLLFLRDRTGNVDPARNRMREEREGGVWDDGTPDLAARMRGWPAGRAPQWLRAPGRGQQWLVGGITLAPRRRSVIFEIGTRLVFHTMVMLSLYLLFAGHNQPGGGFSGGLVAGTALMVRYLAGGRYELGEALPLQAGHLLGGGLVVATSAALVPLAFGGQALQTAVFEFVLPVWGDVKIATALIFDIGVYVLVLGLVLDVLRSLGAEIDRHGEIEGVSDAETDADSGAEVAP